MPARRPQWDRVARARHPIFGPHGCQAGAPAIGTAGGDTSGQADDGRWVPEDGGSCKGLPPDCRLIVIRLRSGIKARSDRTHEDNRPASSTGTSPGTMKSGWPAWSSSSPWRPSWWPCWWRCMHGLTGAPAGSPRRGCRRAQAVRYPGAPYRLRLPDSSIPIRGTQPKLRRSVASARRRLAGCGIAGVRSGGGTRSAIRVTDAAGACPDRTQDALDIGGMILDNAAGRDAER